MVARSYKELYGLDYTILRYGIPFGPRMRDALVISKFVRAALAGETITVDGDGSQYRNYLYVEDMARAHVLALMPEAANEVFNLEGTEKVTVRGLVESIQRVVDRPVAVEFGEARAGDYAGRPVSAAKAADILGWIPTVSFEHGLRRYVDWHVGEHLQRAINGHPRMLRSRRRFALVASAVAAVLMASSVSLVGATSASAAWFGSVVSHAPRLGHRVAVTVEVPSLPTARPLLAAFDAAGVKATFFTSGMSVSANSALARSLVAGGHVLGAESYHARRTELLDPSYHGLARSGEAFVRAVGRCPTFFRPPRGAHTPFMARVAHRSGMTMVTWDVALGASGVNPDVLARRLQRIRPGSIVSIRVRSARGAVADERADVVPALLDGLRARHLEPVGLDELLGLPAYAGRC
jgi:peptidoglycan/xylan/chitin deacetylase (PgdA/CDA1 family)